MSGPYEKFIEALVKTESSIAITNGSGYATLDQSLDAVDIYKQYFLIKGRDIFNISSSEFYVIQSHDLPYTFHDVHTIEYQECTNKISQYIAYDSMSSLKFVNCSIQEFAKQFQKTSINIQDCELQSLDSLKGDNISLMIVRGLNNANKGLKKIGGTQELSLHACDIMLGHHIISAENDIKYIRSFTLNSEVKVKNLLHTFKFIKESESCGIITRGINLYHIIHKIKNDEGSTIYDFASKLIEHGLGEDEVCL